jgi:hypothetical protein
MSNIKKLLPLGTEAIENPDPVTAYALALHPSNPISLGTAHATTYFIADKNNFPEGTIATIETLRMQSDFVLGSTGFTPISLLTILKNHLETGYLRTPDCKAEYDLVNTLLQSAMWLLVEITALKYSSQLNIDKDLTKTLAPGLINELQKYAGIEKDDSGVEFEHLFENDQLEYLQSRIDDLTNKAESIGLDISDFIKSKTVAPAPIESEESLIPESFYQKKEQPAPIPATSEEVRQQFAQVTNVAFKVEPIAPPVTPTKANEQFAEKIGLTEEAIDEWNAVAKISLSTATQSIESTPAEVAVEEVPEVKRVINWGFAKQNFRGGWNPLTNQPRLENGQNRVGHYYIASHSGTVNLGDGPLEISQGDSIRCSADLAWEIFQKKK